MNNSQGTTWQSFKSKLSRQNELNLQFQYAENKWINPAYHITEIKRASIDSVDCGGRADKWEEVVVQLWVPEADKKEKAMTAQKALSIISIVEAKLVLDPESIVKIEYGNSDFDTRQMLIDSIDHDETNLIVNLTRDVTQCKANEVCGIRQPVALKLSACCDPASACC